MNYRQGNINDLQQLKVLALKSWAPYEQELTSENWDSLKENLVSDNSFIELIERSFCLVCENNNNEIIGMGFLVPHGNPTEIYDENCCYIRFVSVDPEYAGKGMGRQITERCIQLAKLNKEQTIALHTSEMMNKARQLYENLGFKIIKQLPQKFGKKYWLYSLDISG